MQLKPIFAAGILLAAMTARAQTGVLVASDFAAWSLPAGITPANGMLQWQSGAVCQVLSSGYNFTAVKIGRPLTIVDANPQHTETVTPSAVTITGSTCTIAATMLYTHSTYTVISGTAGLQEAIDYSARTSSQGGAVVVLTPSWSWLGGNTGMITAATGQNGTALLDERAAAMCTYAWNGSAYQSSGCVQGSNNNLLSLSNAWAQLQIMAQGVQINNNSPIIAGNSAGQLGRLAYVDVSNNYYFGDISNLYSGNGFWMYAGSPALTFAASGITFSLPPIFGSMTLNGSQSLNGVQGSTATKLLTASGTFTAGDCVKVATDGSATDAGAGCGAGGGAVTSITTTGSSGPSTLSSGVLNIPVYTVSGVADIDVAIPSLTIAANTAFPAYPTAASTASMPGATTAMVVLCGFSGDPVITNGWGQNGGLKISPWVSAAGTISYRIYNQTGSSITSNATTIRCMAQ